MVPVLPSCTYKMASADGFYLKLGIQEVRGVTWDLKQLLDLLILYKTFTLYSKLFIPLATQNHNFVLSIQ